MASDTKPASSSIHCQKSDPWKLPWPTWFTTCSTRVMGPHHQLTFQASECLHTTKTWQVGQVSRHASMKVPFHTSPYTARKYGSRVELTAFASKFWLSMVRPNCRHRRHQHKVRLCSWQEQRGTLPAKQSAEAGTKPWSLLESKHDFRAAAHLFQNARLTHCSAHLRMALDPLLRKVG
jgi:hypothetical protein